MSTWRRKAIETLPHRRSALQQPDTSLHEVFSAFMRPELEEAHQNNDKEKLKKIYAFAQWCFQQKEEKLWNTAGVAFYEHLLDGSISCEAFHQWVIRPIYIDVRGLLLRFAGEDKIAMLDKLYSYKP